MLKIYCIRQINCIQFYRKKKVTIISQDLILRKLLIFITLLSMLIKKFEPINKKWLANQILQKLIN